MRSLRMADGTDVSGRAVEALARLERRWPGATLPQARCAIVAIVADAVQPVVTTADDLDALPNGAVVMVVTSREVYQKETESHLSELYGDWYAVGSEVSCSAHDILAPAWDARVVVLWAPAVVR